MFSALQLISFSCIVAFTLNLPQTAHAQESLSWQVIETPASLSNGIRFFGVSGSTLFLQTTFEGILSANDGSNVQWEPDISAGLLGNSIMHNVAELTAAGPPFLLTSNGIWRADQAGNYARHGAAISPEPFFNGFRDIIVLLNGDWYAATAIGVFYSDNQGQAWSLELDIREAQRVRMLSDGSLLVAAGRIAFGEDVTQAAGLWRSSVEMLTWQSGLYADETSFTLRDLEVTADGTWLVAAQSPSSTITISQDGGTSWTASSFSDISPEIIVLDNGDILAAAANSGVALSTDGGGSWPRFNQGLLDNRILYLAVSTDGHAYCADVFGNVYRSNRTFNDLGTSVAEQHISGSSLLWLSESETLTVNTSDATFGMADILLEIYDLRGARLMQQSIASGMGLRGLSLGGLPSGPLVVRVSGQGFAHALVVVN